MTAAYDEAALTRLRPQKSSAKIDWLNFILYILKSPSIF
jgi:hypothetical protein